MSKKTPMTDEKVNLQTDQKFLEGSLNLLINWEPVKIQVNDLVKSNVFSKLLMCL